MEEVSVLSPRVGTWSQRTQTFSNGLQQTCTTFVLEGEITFILPDTEEAASLLQRERYLYIPRLFSIQTSLKTYQSKV